MTTGAEKVLARSLRQILAGEQVAGPISESQTFYDFQAALERVLPDALAQEHPWWRGEALDGFRFAIAQKVSPNEAEFLGLALLLDDQAWTPVFVRVRLASNSEAI